MITCVLWDIESQELENGCNHEGSLTFTIILEFCSPVYKRIYFIEFISELYILNSLVNSI